MIKKLISHSMADVAQGGSENQDLALPVFSQFLPQGLVPVPDKKDKPTAADKNLRQNAKDKNKGIEKANREGHDLHEKDIKHLVKWAEAFNRELTRLRAISIGSNGRFASAPEDYVQRVAALYKKYLDLPEVKSTELAATRKCIQKTAKTFLENLSIVYAYNHIHGVHASKRYKELDLATAIAFFKTIETESAFTSSVLPLLAGKNSVLSDSFAVQLTVDINLYVDAVAVNTAEHHSRLNPKFGTSYDREMALLRAHRELLKDAVKRAFSSVGEGRVAGLYPAVKEGFATKWIVPVDTVLSQEEMIRRAAHELYKYTLANPKAALSLNKRLNNALTELFGDDDTGARLHVALRRYIASDFRIVPTLVNTSAIWTFIAIQQDMATQKLDGKKRKKYEGLTASFKAQNQELVGHCVQFLAQAERQRQTAQRAQAHAGRVPAAAPRRRPPGGQQVLPPGTVPGARRSASQTAGAQAAPPARFEVPKPPTSVPPAQAAAPIPTLNADTPTVTRRSGPPTAKKPASKPAAAAGVNPPKGAAAASAVPEFPASQRDSRADLADDSDTRKIDREINEIMGGFITMDTSRLAMFLEDHVDQLNPTQLADIRKRLNILTIADDQKTKMEAFLKSGTDRPGQFFTDKRLDSFIGDELVGLSAILHNFELSSFQVRSLLGAIHEQVIAHFKEIKDVFGRGSVEASNLAAFLRVLEHSGYSYGVDPAILVNRFNQHLAGRGSGRLAEPNAVTVQVMQDPFPAFRELLALDPRLGRLLDGFQESVESEIRIQPEQPSLFALEALIEFMGLLQNLMQVGELGLGKKTPQYIRVMECLSGLEWWCAKRVSILVHTKQHTPYFQRPDFSAAIARLSTIWESNATSSTLSGTDFEEISQLMTDFRPEFRPNGEPSFLETLLRSSVVSDAQYQILATMMELLALYQVDRLSVQPGITSVQVEFARADVITLEMLQDYYVRLRNMPFSLPTLGLPAVSVVEAPEPNVSDLLLKMRLLDAIAIDDWTSFFVLLPKRADDPEKLDTMPLFAMLTELSFSSNRSLFVLMMQLSATKIWGNLVNSLQRDAIQLIHNLVEFGQITPDSLSTMEGAASAVYHWSDDASGVFLNKLEKVAHRCLFAFKKGQISNIYQESEFPERLGMILNILAALGDRADYIKSRIAQNLEQLGRKDLQERYLPDTVTAEVVEEGVEWKGAEDFTTTVGTMDDLTLGNWFAVHVVLPATDEEFGSVRRGLAVHSEKIAVVNLRDKKFPDDSSIQVGYGDFSWAHLKASVQKYQHTLADPSVTYDNKRGLYRKLALFLHPDKIKNIPILGFVKEADRARVIGAMEDIGRSIIDGWSQYEATRS